MKDLSDRDKILQSLKNISDAGGVQALNYLLTENKNVSDSHRNYCLQFFIQEKITSVTIIDRQKLQEIEKVRSRAREKKEVIPHPPVIEDFLDVLITAMQSSKKDNFFYYERNQLLLITDEKIRKPVENVLRQMGLKVIYFEGLLK